MPSTAFLIVGTGVLFHLILGRWVFSPWLVPDLTLVCVVLAMARLSGHPLMPALLGGLLVMSWTVRQPFLMGCAYVGAGWLIRRVAARWALADLSVQLAAVGVAEAFLLAIGFFLNDVPMSLGLLLLAGMRLFITVACLPLARSLLGALIRVA